MSQFPTLPDGNLAPRQQQGALERVAAAFRASPISLVINRQSDGAIVDTSDSALELLGVDRQSLLAHSPAALGQYTDPAEFLLLAERLRRDARVAAAEIVLRRSDGTTRQVSVGIEPLDLDGDRYWLTTLNDITEQRRLEAQIREQARWTAQRQALTNLLSETMTREQVVQVVLQHALPAIGAATAIVAVLDERGHEFEMVGFSGLPDERMQAWRRFPARPGLPLADAVRSGESLFFSNLASAAARYPELMPTASGNQAFALIPFAAREHVVGGMSLSFDKPREFTDAEREFLRALASDCAQALERARLYAAEQVARHASEQAAQAASRSAERLARLESVTAVLSQALTPDEVTAVILNQGASLLGASGAAVLLVSEDGQWLTRVASVGYPSEVQQPFGHYPVDRAIPAAEAVRTGQAVWMESAEVYRSRYPQLSAAITAIGYEAAAAVPLQFEKRVAGVLALSFPNTLEFTEDVRYYISTLAGYCAQALERARLYAAERAAHNAAEHSRDQVQRLQRLTAQLAAAASPSEVLDVVVREAAAALGAQACAFWSPTADGEHLALTASTGYPGNASPVERPIALTERLPATDAYQRGAAVWIESNDAYGQTYRLLHDRRSAFGLEAAAAVPLTHAGRMVGVLGLSFSEARQFSGDDQGLLSAVAELFAEALERARLYMAEQQAREAAEQAAREARQVAERMMRLENVTAALSQALTPGEVTEVILRGGARLLGAAAAVVRRVSADGQWLTQAVGIGFPEVASQSLQAFPTDRHTPAGDTARTGKPIWIKSAKDYLARYPHLSEQIAARGHEAITTVPLFYEGRVVGVLTLSFSQAMEFTDDVQRFILTLADYCAQALERARLFEAEQQARAEAQRLNAELEQRVQARTAELAQEVEQRRTAEAQLAQSYEQLQALSGRIEAAREDERRRLSVELHDQLGSALTSLKMEVARLRRRLATEPEAAPKIIETLYRSIDEMIELVRRIATELRPALLDHFGLAAALEWQLNEFQRRSGLTCQIQAPEDSREPAPEAAIAVFRVFQECLTNIARHAQATEVLVQVQDHGDHLSISVHDNGRGLTTGKLTDRNSLGLLGMRERLRQVSGEFTIHGDHHEGTTVTVRVPLPAVGPRL